MTDLTALTEITTPTTDDLVYVVDAPTGAKNPRKCSIANLVASANIDAAKITSGTLPLARLTGITTTNLSASAGITSGQLAGLIAISKLAVDPLARANHTGVQAHTTISDFDTGVQANRLDQMAAPNAAVALGSQKITGLAAGVADTDAANKGQVDAAQAGLDAKDACRVATTANITLSGEQAIDGVTTTTDRVLVKNQSTANQNGIYVSASGAWARSTDADANAEVTSGLYTFITEGTANGSTGFVLTTDDPITVGTTGLTFSQFSGLAQLVGGTGITKIGNTINVDAVQTQVTDVGALDEGSITSGFGAIDNGASAITTTGTITGGKVTADNLDIDANQISASNAGGHIELAPKTTGFLKVIGNDHDGAITLNCTNNNHGQTIKSQPHSEAASNTLLLPKTASNAQSTLVAEISTQTLTNKTLTSPQINTKLDILAEGELRFQDASGGQYVAVEAPATVGTSYTVKLPAAIGSVGDALKVTGVAGAVQTMEWDSAGGGAHVTQEWTATTAPANPSTGTGIMYMKTIDSNNEGLFMKMRKNNQVVEVQIA